MLVTLLALALAVGVLAASAPPGAAQVVPSPIASVTGTLPASAGSGSARGSLAVAIESPATDQQLHTDRDFLIVGTRWTRARR
jgi:hypothetical protein